MLYTSLSFEHKKYIPNSLTEIQWNRIQEQENKIRFINNKEGFRGFINTKLNQKNKEVLPHKKDTFIIVKDNLEQRIINGANKQIKDIQSDLPTTEIKNTPFDIKKCLVFYSCFFYVVFFT
jgi:hypothetical protein